MFDLSASFISNLLLSVSEQFSVWIIVLNFLVDFPEQPFFFILSSVTTDRVISLK